MFSFKKEIRTLLFPRHHHPTVVGLHGVRCDAQSCTVAATGGVLVPSQDHSRNTGAAAITELWTPGNRALFRGAPPKLLSDGIYGSIIGNA
ncbi:hypothetical protein PBY51_002009 [Eleginops maclovinus]|uniref:Uncharacterized protein n=1 Tax=Eleginops maclovinus TaxID=56733 RepID=A0AAN7WX37_ELEMC|nr:hypothetical protein PBY51_002009 [Eleginops maclovinus]